TRAVGVFGFGLAELQPDDLLDGKEEALAAVRGERDLPRHLDALDLRDLQHLLAEADEGGGVELLGDEERRAVALYAGDALQDLADGKQHADNLKRNPGRVHAASTRRPVARKLCR